MTLRLNYILVATLLLCSCGDASNDQAMQADAGPAAMTSNSSGYDRRSFVLCPALASHRQALADIVGIEPDPDRALSMSPSSRKYFVRGKGGDFIGFEMPPAMIKSIKRHATESFDGAASPAPELGNVAMYVDNIGQPRVIFSMGPVLIDVHASNSNTPDREMMVTLAARVRDILAQAN